jgi:hypothetical protein
MGGKEAARIGGGRETEEASASQKEIEAAPAIEKASVRFFLRTNHGSFPRLC